MLSSVENTTYISSHRLTHSLNPKPPPTPLDSTLASRFLQPTNTPILRLPREEIHQRRQRLPHKTEADPKNTIPNHPPVNAPHLLQRRGEIYHRQLHHHAYERHAQDIVRRDPHQEFVQKAGEDEDHRAGEAAAEPPTDERRVDVPPHEMVDGFVPRAPVVAHRRTVPPIRVEFAVTKTHDFRQGVEDGLEDGEEAGEPDDEGDGGEFHQAFDDGGDVQGGHFV